MRLRLVKWPQQQVPVIPVKDPGALKSPAAAKLLKQSEISRGQTAELHRFQLRRVFHHRLKSHSNQTNQSNRTTTGLFVKLLNELFNFPILKKNLFALMLIAM